MATRISIGAAALAALLYGPTASGAAAGQPPSPSATAVVELFTSQGCSSCPPADALLREIADEPGVIALSLHVDYWDRLGWTDPYGRSAHTRRQRRYARTIDGDQWHSGVYTPQIVVDGTRAMVGHRESTVRQAIAQARARETVTPRFTGVGPDAVTLPAQAGEQATVWLVAYDRRHTTAIERGENRGRTLVNAFVVRAMERLGTWHGQSRRFALDAAARERAGRDGLAVLVQRPNQGAIVGAAQTALEAP